MSGSHKIWGHRLQLLLQQCPHYFFMFSIKTSALAV